MADDYKVPYTVIKDIQPHNNAERLEVATIYGFQVIVGKGTYKLGDKVVYIPIDSVIKNKKLEDLLFPEGSKIKLHNSRVKQIKIRGLASQGMAINPETIASIINLDRIELETDLATILDIEKYEPPQSGFAQTIGKDKQRNKKEDHPLFHRYNGLNNIKWFPDLFKEGENVIIEEKMHGTNSRASVLPYHANTLWKKIKKALRIAPKYENCYGSNNIEISAKTSFTGYYGQDVYGECFKKMDIFSKIKPGEIVFGEIIGPGIQKNYAYRLTEHKFVVFDVKVLQPDDKFKWLNPDDVVEYCKSKNLEHVPVLYRGPYNKELAYTLTKGSSVYDPKTKVREGIVIKAVENYDTEGNKKALKWINEDYLSDDTNTDFH